MFIDLLPVHGLHMYAPILLPDLTTLSVHWTERRARSDQRVIRLLSYTKTAQSATDEKRKREKLYQQHLSAPFASLKKQGRTLFELICCERKTLFGLEKKSWKRRIIKETNMPLFMRLMVLENNSLFLWGDWGHRRQWLGGVSWTHVRAFLID